MYLPKTREDSVYERMGENYQLLTSIISNVYDEKLTSKEEVLDALCYLAKQMSHVHQEFAMEYGDLPLKDIAEQNFESRMKELNDFSEIIQQNSGRSR